MKAAKYLLTLLAGGSIAIAQPGGDVIVNLVVFQAKYCLGHTSYMPSKGQPEDSDITLRLSLKVSYENNRTEPIIVPLIFRSTARVALIGEEPQNFPAKQDTRDPAALLQAAWPVPQQFVVIPDQSKLESPYIGDGFDLPVRSTTRQWLGKTIQVSVVRDHGLLTPAGTAALQAKWQVFGKLWTGTQTSDTVTISIPESPKTEDCRKDDRF